MDFFFFQAEDGIRDVAVTGVQTCALPISVASRVGTSTGIPPTRRACSGYEPQYGLGIRTSSPGSRTATAILKRVCLAPHETSTSSGSYASPWSRLSLAHTAARSSGTPATSVYFVWPRRIASTAAALMRSGVSKSGSPAPNEMTSTPRARSALALAWTASVDDGASVFTRSASTVCGSFGGGPPGYLGGNFSASRFSTIGGTIPVTDVPKLATSLMRREG